MTFDDQECVKVEYNKLAKEQKAPTLPTLDASPAYKSPVLDDFDLKLDINLLDVDEK